MKFKQIPNEYFITILDRLTRFEPACVRYKRVIDDIINNNYVEESGESTDTTLVEKHEYKYKKDSYENVTGNPVCYWASKQIIESFQNKSIKDLGNSCVGLVTGDNERFIRNWYEVDHTKCGFGLSREMAISSSTLKWFPINQSGDYRKWYGNNLDVFDWWHDGFNIKKFKLDRYLRGEAEKKNSKCWNEESYFHEGLTWSRISTDRFSARHSFVGCTAGTTCPIYFTSKDHEKYILGLLNSKVIEAIVAFLNPTVSFQAADIDRIPVIEEIKEKPNVEQLVENSISKSKEDWDSFETSWDFKRHPLI